MLNNIKAAMIDLDGTLLDTAPDFVVGLNAMRAEFDLPPLDIATVKTFVGQGTEDLVKRSLQVGLSDAEVARHFDAAMNSYRLHYRAVNGMHATRYPDVVEGLQALQAQGLRLACVTNKPMAFTVSLLVKKDLAGYFDLVLGGDSLPRKKPDPMPLLHVAHEFALDPAQIVMIGDSSNDAKAARAAGCPVLLLPYGYNHGESVQDVDCDGIVATLLEAAALLPNKRT
jgi:phosphoglycolate phosphatase